LFWALEKDVKLQSGPGGLCFTHGSQPGPGNHIGGQVTIVFCDLGGLLYVLKDKLAIAERALELI